MLAVAGRVRKTVDFRAIQSEGAMLRGTLVRVSRRPSEATNYGIIVSTKVSPRAVDRNRIKRQLRAALAELQPSGDVVVTALAAARGATYQDLMADLKKVLA